MTERRGPARHVEDLAFTITNLQLSAMDVLVLTTMKNAAKCDTKSELQNPVNLYVFERMLRFRVLLEACLFECLFSPLASPPRQTEGALADFGLSDRNSLWSVDPSGETTGNSFQCRVCLRNQRGALAIVQNCLGPEAVLDQSDPGSSVPPFSVENSVFRNQKAHSTFGPQIRQEDPLNLSI